MEAKIIAVATYQVIYGVTGHTNYLIYDANTPGEVGEEWHKAARKTGIVKMKRMNFLRGIESVPRGWE